MKKNLIVIFALLLISQFSLAIETTNNTANNSTKIKSTIKTNLKKNSKETAKTEPTEKKKKKSFFAIFDFVGKIKEFVGSKSKQNENAIEDAATGNFKASAKRELSSDPKAHAIQEKLNKLQAEHLKKYKTN